MGNRCLPEALRPPGPADPSEDTRAFQALVRQLKGRVYATAYRLMGSREDAEDQAQEVFIKVYRGIQDLDDPATVTAWIYRLTVNTCFDALRKQGRSPNTTAAMLSSADRDEEPQVADPNVAMPEEIALRRELHDCLEGVLQRLDPVERGVLVLRDVEVRPYQEIAETLAIGLARRRCASTGHVSPSSNSLRAFARSCGSLCAREE